MPPEDVLEMGADLTWVLKRSFAMSSLATGRWMTSAAVSALAFFAAAGGAVAADGSEVEDVDLPFDVPPVFASARAVQKNRGAYAVLEVTITAPELVWEAAKCEIPEGKTATWTEIDAKVRAKQWKILHGDLRSQIPDSLFMRINGEEMSLPEVAKALKDKTPVLLSLTGKHVDSYYAKFMKPDTIVIVLARDDGMGDRALLLREQTAEE
jgi:hypothetical protein